MQNIVLTIHLILAVLLTGIVLLQRSEGGGLGMGGGSGGGVMSGRQAANAMTRLTWIFGIALFVTSISLTIIAARQSSNSSIMDQLGVPESQQGSGEQSGLEYTPPPSAGDDPLTPPAPATPTVDGAANESSDAPAALTPPAPEAAESDASGSSESVATPADDGAAVETPEPAGDESADDATSEGGEAAGAENSQQSN